MKSKIYIYGLCDVFYDAYYILGLKEIFGDFEFNILKFPKFKQATFAVIIENENGIKKIIIDSLDSPKIDLVWLDWCDVYGKVNYNQETIPVSNQKKIIAIGPSFGIKIWNLLETSFYLISNYGRFKTAISHKREFVANYWRQYKRFRLKKYRSGESSKKEVFFISSIWKKEKETNTNRALFIEACQNNSNVIFEGGFAARVNGDNLGFDNFVYSKKIPLEVYIQKIKKSAIVFNTPAVLSCHGWKLAEFLALGKAIITTSHFNKLPSNLKNYQQVIYANNREDIAKVIDELMTDFNLRRKLELESRRYFETYLAPKVVIQKLVDNLVTE